MWNINIREKGETEIIMKHPVYVIGKKMMPFLSRGFKKKNVLGRIIAPKVIYVLISGAPECYLI